MDSALCHYSALVVAIGLENVNIQVFDARDNSERTVCEDHSQMDAIFVTGDGCSEPTIEPTLFCRTQKNFFGTVWVGPAEKQ